MRLETILRRFPVAVDLGARNGAFSRALAASDAREDRRAVRNRPVGADAGNRQRPQGRRRRGAPAVRRRHAGPGGLDPVAALDQRPGRRADPDPPALRPDGLFIGAIFGGATLTELRQALLQAEDEVSGGASFRVSPFADAIDAAGLLQRAGFALPVADVDRVKVRYGHPIELLRDLRRMGETSVLLDRSRKPMSRRVLLRAMEIYVERFAEPTAACRRPSRSWR
jgi:hypothetical protein